MRSRKASPWHPICSTTTVPRSSPGCAPPAASTPRTRPRCSPPPPTRRRHGDLTDRRVAGEPLEHLLGWAEFCGRRVAVDPGVFVPGPRTALLVEAAASVARPAPAVVDLCCGSGAISVALVDRLAPRWLAAVDVDPAAVACARRNLAGPGRHGRTGRPVHPLPRRWRGRLDVVVANAPYVPTPAVALMPAEARLHEAPVALDGGCDGLAVLRRVARRCGPTGCGPAVTWWWRPAPGRRSVLCAAMTGAGLLPTVLRAEERDATAVTARRPAEPAGWPGVAGEKGWN